MKVFLRHFEIAEKFSLPMIFHNKDATNDFFDVVRKNRNRFSEGVLNS